jgi:hypothetical protein
MNRTAYTYENPSVTRYTFTSVGKRKIKKVVEFSRFGVRNTFNLAFGDLLPDGVIDDLANSNNGDITKVLATVIRILRDFTIKKPRAYIAFTGSTKERMKLYSRILKFHYPEFSNEFKISGFVQVGEGYEKIPFDPARLEEYIVYIIKRIT